MEEGRRKLENLMNFLGSLIRLKFILSLSKGSRFFLFRCLSEVEGNEKEKELQSSRAARNSRLKNIDLFHL